MGGMSSFPKFRGPWSLNLVCNWNNGEMGMRTECKHYESRSYENGEVVRKCRIDMAPGAPWECPADCDGFILRRADVGWDYGSLSAAQVPVAEHVTMDDDIAALLDSAEDIVNSAAPEILAEMEKLDKSRGLFNSRRLGKSPSKKKKKKKK